MTDLFADIWPMLVSIAIHPVAITLALVLAGRAHGAKSAACFAGGFCAGLLATCAVGRLLALVLHGPGGGDSRHIAAWMTLAAGVIVALWALSLVVLRANRSRLDFLSRSIPRMLSLSMGGLVLHGFKGAALNPKDLAVSLAFGARLGVLDEGQERAIMAVAVFLFLIAGTLPLLAPAIVSGLGTAPARERLDGLSEQIRGHYLLASAVVLVVMGLNMIRSAMERLAG